MVCMYVGGDEDMGYLFGRRMESRVQNPVSFAQDKRKGMYVCMYVCIYVCMTMMMMGDVTEACMYVCMYVCMQALLSRDFEKIMEYFKTVPKTVTPEIMEVGFHQIPLKRKLVGRQEGRVREEWPVCVGEI